MRPVRSVYALFLAVPLAACGADATSSASDHRAALASQRSAAAAERAYSIHPQTDTDLCLSVAGGKNENGAAVELARCSGKAEQKWARYGGEIRVFGDKCLQVKDAQDADGAAVVVGDCKANAAGSTFTLTASQFTWGAHEAKDKCLDVKDGKFVAGSALQMWSCSTPEGANDHQQFYVLESGTAVAAPNAAPNASKPATTDKGVIVAAPKPASSSTPTKPADAAPKPSAPATAPAAPSSNVFGPAPAGVLVAPYYYDWGVEAGFANSLVEAKNKGGVKAATIAFGLSGGGCAVTGFSSLTDDIKAFQQAGGTVVLSFGGAAGTYVQATCAQAADLAKAISEQMAAYRTNLVDFDIEGDNLNDTEDNARLLDALVSIQQSNAQAHFSFTLPVDPDSGLPDTARALLKSAAAKGLRVGRVNIMTMDYGRKPVSPKTAGDFAISAAQALFKQMKQIWPGASDAAVYHAIGITPMIGQNDGDQDAPFLVSDAQKVAAWAKQQGIGLLAFWALKRDLAAGGDYNNHSNNQSADYAFYKAFAAAQ